MEYMFLREIGGLLPPTVLYLQKKGTKRFHNTKSRDKKVKKKIERITHMLLVINQ
jgi:hypothetical protein